MKKNALQSALKVPYKDCIGPLSTTKAPPTSSEPLPGPRRRGGGEWPEAAGARGGLGAKGGGAGGAECLRLGLRRPQRMEHLTLR